jgi:hypothetical protein
MTKTLRVGLAALAAASALTFAACSDEDGDGAGTDEEVDQVDEQMEDTGDQIQEEVDEGQQEVEDE